MILEYLNKPISGGKITVDNELMELKELINQKEIEIKECNQTIEDDYSKLELLTDEMNDLQRAYNKLLYKDINISSNTYYHFKTDEYGYHGNKEILISIDKVDDYDVLYRKFIIKDDDGDEYFYIEKKHCDPIDFITDLKEGNFVEINKDKAQSLLNSFLVLGI